MRRGTLLLHRAGDCRGDFVDVADGGRDGLDGRHRLLGRRSDAVDLIADFLGRLGRLIGQVLDFRGNHGKALAGIAGARRLDGRVERQQVGLIGDLGNQIDDLADPLRRLGQFLNLLIGLFGVGHGAAGDFAGARHLAADLGDRA